MTADRILHWRLVVLVLAELLLFPAPPARADGIDDLVGQVSTANIQAHVATLAAAPRDTAAAMDAAADYIDAELASYGYTVTRTAVGSSENVSVEVPGTVAADRVFIIGAHFDSASGSPGADDNAASVAALLEIARVLAGSAFPGGIELVAYGLEESGLLGSTAHAAATALAGRDVAGMISLEMIAYTCSTPGCTFVFPDVLPCFDVVDPDVVSDVGNWIAMVASSDHVGLGRRFFDAAARYVPSLPVGWAVVSGNGSCFPDTRRSDHAPYWDRGLPAVMVTDTANFRNPNYHQPGDLPSTLDYPFATSVARAALATAVRAALRPCPSVPLDGCKQSTVASRSSLTLTDGTPDSGDRVTFKWQAGDATSAAELGDPSTTDGYALCIYDGDRSVVFAGQAVAAGTCGTRPCWKGLGSPAGAKGFKYSDPVATRDGIAKVLLQPGAAGRAKALVKGKGVDLQMPSDLGVPLPLALPATVQLQGSHGECFEAHYFADGAKKNDPEQFKGRGDSPSTAFIE